MEETQSKHKGIAKVFKALSDETRVKALELLKSGEKCACVLLKKVCVNQSTLSHHMKILVDSGIVLSRKQGKWTYYSISEEGSKNALKILKELTTVTILEGNDDNAGCCD
jgi:ArsR family transcriptional regulator